MILFKLRCGQQHEFEGWFRDNAAFDRQAARGQIQCPDCGATEIEKALMAPRLGRSAEAPAKAPPTPQQLRRMLQELRRQVEANCDNVGDRFAEEARRIHYGETEPRGIYGDATSAEAAELVEEGIEVARIPWVAPSDA